MLLNILNPKKYYFLFIEVINFLRNPYLNENNIGKKNRITNTIILIVIKLILAIIVGFISRIIIWNIGIQAENIGFKNAEELYTSFELLVIGAIIFPLLEETGFRLYLRFRPIYLSLSSTVLCYYFITKVIYKTNNLDINNDFIIRVVISIFLGILVFLISTKYQKHLQKFWKTNIRWILYFSIFLFGFVHILNYELSIKVFLLFPLITLPQLVSGALMGFARINYGFIYGLSMHMISNFIYLSLLILIK
ncbi:CPBP family intramembrane metalloprotease [Weeksellaceae bacterium TAE3-ERU29]|nr:CPBP family intramembrane metalloprotease [Weeksellaceae bacterium TAE3-ERU29]